MTNSDSSSLDRDPDEAHEHDASDPWHNRVRSRSDPLGGRYRLLEEIGAGASSITYRGRDERLGREVAIKILREHHTIDPSLMRRFEREARAAAAVSHSNVVDIHDFGTDTDRPYIVMDYIDGENLKERLARVGPLPPAEAVQIARQVLAGLAAVHRAGIIHRDIKPQNILLGRDGIARLADFGVAHLSAETGLTTTGTTLGTAAYMAPEQAQGGPLVPATDLYAVGVVLYEMLTGYLPFDAPTSMGVIYAHIHAQPIPPSWRAPGRATGSALDVLVTRVLAKRPEERFASADELRYVLAEHAAHSNTSTEMETTPIEAVNAPTFTLWAAQNRAASAAAHAGGRTGPSPARSRGAARWLVWGMTLLVLLVLGGGGAGVWLLNQEGDDDGADPSQAAIVVTGSATLAPPEPGTPSDQPQQLAASTLERTTLPIDTPEPLQTRTPTPFSNDTPVPTVTQPPVPTTPPLPTTTPSSTDTPSLIRSEEPIVSGSTANAAVGIVPVNGGSAQDQAPVPGADGEDLIVVDQDGATQVIEPVDQANPSANLDDEDDVTQAAELAFEAWDWQGAYYQESGNLQPWSALYAQSTGYGTGTVSFTVPGQPAADTFVVTVEGMTSESWGPVPIEIRVNGQTVYADTSPFPIWNGVDGQQPWTTVQFELPASLLRPGDNTLTCVNMVGDGGFSLPPYILLASATVTVKVIGASDGSGL